MEEKESPRWMNILPILAYLLILALTYLAMVGNG